MGSNRIRVPIKGTIGKSVLLPTGGATIGLDLKLPDGSTPTLAQLATALGVTATPVASSTTVSSLYSVTGDGSPSRPLQLNGDTATPGNSKFYGTSASGARGWQSLVVADSVVGNGVGTPLSLSGDVSAPGNNYFYGTNGTGVKGWAAQSALALTSGQVTTALGFTPYNATNPSA
ncbi:MAG: hypothetical protein KGL39_14795, partial [Patescibacteria group bacterium]|nr:hypothetical protein [Patescibacteria group bacterium]